MITARELIHRADDAVHAFDASGDSAKLIAAALLLIANELRRVNDKLDQLIDKDSQDDYAL